MKNINWVLISKIKDYLLVIGEGIALITAILSLVFTNTNLIPVAIIISSFTLFIVAILNKLDKTWYIKE